MIHWYNMNTFGYFFHTVLCENKSWIQISLRQMKDKLNNSCMNLKFFENSSFQKSFFQNLISIFGSGNIYIHCKTDL